MKPRHVSISLVKTSSSGTSRNRSGDVGRRLANGLLEIGHQVKLGTRDTSKKEVVEWIAKYRKTGDINQFEALINHSIDSIR